MMKRLIFQLLPALLLKTTMSPGQSLADTLRHADWHLLWDNEFSQAGDSSTVATHWQFAYPWGRTLTGEGQYYSGKQVQVDSMGILHLQACRRPAARAYRSPGGRSYRLPYESGMLFSAPRHDSLALAACGDRTGFGYGLFEIRCRLPDTPHSFPAFWLYGAPDEVDIFEADGSDMFSNNAIQARHEFWRPATPGVGGEASQNFFYWAGPGRLTDDFHTFALSWLPQELIYYFDGVPIRRETRLLPLGCSLELIADLAMFSWASAPAAALDIDYIRVYSPRLPSPVAPVAPIAPAAGLLAGPRSTAAVYYGSPPEQWWRVPDKAGYGAQLALQGNRNAIDFNVMALPYKGIWRNPLVTYGAAASPRHRVASPDSGRSPLHWILRDAFGRLIWAGEQPPAQEWELRFPELDAGAYSLELRIGHFLRHQPMYHIERAAETVLKGQWHRPPPADADN